MEALKQSYTHLTKDIVYAHKELVLKTITEKLIIKAFEAIQRKEKETLSNENKMLEQKVNFLEKDVAAKKQEFEQERQQLQAKIYESQSEL